MSLKTELRDSEYKARIRDEQVRNGGLTDSELAEKQSMVAELVNEIEAKTGKTVAIFQNKKYSKVKFAQMIQENIQYLIEENYLTNAEKAFLFDVTFLVGFKSNGLVETIDGIQYPLTQEAISKKIKKSRRTVIDMIHSLIDKGIMAKSESGAIGTNAIAYAYFINPNVIFNGDKNEINDTLKLIFIKANKKTFLKKLPVKMF